MDNNTVVLSVVEDLIHWPLPPADPFSVDPATFGAGGADADADVIWREEAPLTAGGAEDLDEEPGERRRSRYDAVLRLPALAQALGSRWAKVEVIPYLLRCIEEEDAELSFVTGMALIDFATSTFMYQRQPGAFLSSSNVRPESLFVDNGRPLSLENLLPVVVSMGASNDAGVRRFLVEVVIPMLFFGVPLERNPDLCDWKAKYLKVWPDGGDGAELGDEPKITFDTNGGNSNNSSRSSGSMNYSYSYATNGGNSGRRERERNRVEMRHSSEYNGGGRNIGKYHAGKSALGSTTEVWDPFQINLYANRLRSSVVTFLRDVSKEKSEAEGPIMASSGNAIKAQDYTEDSCRREAFRSRWTLFVGLMESMLKSEYAAAVSTAVECISNVFSCIAWFERMERRQEFRQSLSPTLLRSTEELVTFVFTTTRTHVGRSIRSGAERPCEDLMMLLSEHRLIVTRNPATSSKIAESRGSIALGCGGLGAAEREVWNLFMGGNAPVMHRVVRMSLLSSLPQLIRWTKTTARSQFAGALDWMDGLSFFSVSNVFLQAIAAPIPTLFASEEGGSGNDDKDLHEDCSVRAKMTTIKEKGKKKGVDTPHVMWPPLESEVCHDSGIAEAVIDGVQHLLDELLRPHTIKDFLQGKGDCNSELTLVEKRDRLLQLCKIYRDCVVGLAALPSWRTRWLATQRLPQITAAVVEVLRRVGDDDPKDGPALVEVCTEFLCQLHVEQWSSAEGRDRHMRELVRDKEEEVRCVISVCAAGVFRALGQGMFCLVFPRGVVVDMKPKRRVVSETHESSSVSKVRHADPAKLDTVGREAGNNGDNGHGGLLSVSILKRLLPKLFDVVFSSCACVLHDPEERVRAGAAAGLSALARTLSAMVMACDLHVDELGKSTWLQYLEGTTMSLMMLLTDKSPTVQIALVTELAALLVSSAVETGRLAATISSHRKDGAAQLRREALITCLQSLSRHEVWRYRERYARILSEMCVKFLAPNSLAAVEAVSLPLGGEAHILEDGLRESSVAAGRPSGVVVAEDGVNPLHGFAKEALLPLLVEVLFDKVKAVRDSALESLEKMCDQLSAARSQLQAASSGDDNSSGVGGVGRSAVDVGGSRGGMSHGTASSSKSNRQKPYHNQQQHDDDVFINDTLWPLIVSSPKAMATYLSRSSLLRIAVRLGVDKESILLPLFDHLGHDAVLNVRLVVAKELYGILAGSSTSASTPAARTSKVTFTDQEKNGVVLQLLRLLVEDKSGDVRDEAAKALKICF
ncbi:hypothetical protein MOQ_009765 [Trypanosoma cruzi marinkellei]|uniref:Uncharacterized protein n=1 Tax=Trypanosoma cruzi marinkellei TaxID=85056 RepID=K2MHE1_TRYCR|nr:hypothetical protein MOQ_009765 [Trypanosoma cruzi marinkellei]